MDASPPDRSKRCLNERIDIRVGVERRRRWGREDKLRIVRESLAPNVAVTAVARRHEITQRFPLCLLPECAGLPLGAPLPLALPRIRQRFLPFAGSDRQVFPCRVFAPHRGDGRIADYMGLMSIFRAAPVPRAGSDLANDRLNACMHMHDAHLLQPTEPSGP